VRLSPKDAAEISPQLPCEAAVLAFLDDFDLDKVNMNGDRLQGPRRRLIVHAISKLRDMLF